MIGYTFSSICDSIMLVSNINNILYLNVTCNIHIQYYALSLQFCNKIYILFNGTRNAIQDTNKYVFIKGSLKCLSTQPKKFNDNDKKWVQQQVSWIAGK